MYSEILIADIKIALDIVQPAIIAFASLLALRQLDLMRQQNSITRESIAIDEMRNLERLLSEHDQLSILAKDNELPMGIEMQEFTLNESMSSDFGPKLGKWHLFYKVHEPEAKAAVHLANQLEVISTSLIRGPAHLATIQDSIAAAFCPMVELNAYTYVVQRHDALYLYQNTIALYRILKPIYKTQKEQQALIRLQVDKLNADRKANMAPK